MLSDHALYLEGAADDQALLGRRPGNSVFLLLVKHTYRIDCIENRFKFQADPP